MFKRLLLAITLMGCSGNATTTPSSVSPDAFVGQWGAINPGREFIRLTITSLSSRPATLGARLTFSGVAWEGSGSIDRDAFRASMATSLTSSFMRTLVARSAATDTLDAQFSDETSSESLTLVRVK